jgi:hypothetical protein
MYLAAFPNLRNCSSVIPRRQARSVRGRSRPESEFPEPFCPVGGKECADSIVDCRPTRAIQSAVAEVYVNNVTRGGAVWTIAGGIEMFLPALSIMLARD